MTTPIERKLLTYLAIIFCTLIILVFLVYKGVQTMSSSSDMVRQTLQVKGEIKELQAQINQTGFIAREYYVTGDSRLLDEYDAVKEQLNNQINKLKEETKDNPNQQKRVETIQRLMDERSMLQGQMILSRKREEFDIIARQLREKRFSENKNELKLAIQEMENEVQALYVERSKREKSDARLAAAIAVIGILIATTSLILTGIGLRQEIAKQVDGEQKLREREQELHLALASSNAGLWFWDIKNDQVAWSDENYGVFGYKPGDCVPSYDLWVNSLHSEDREQVKQELETAIKEKRNYKTEHRIIWPNGETRRLLVRGQAKYDNEGNPIRMSGICLDITELRKTEEALFESEERFRQIAENIEAVLWIRNVKSGQVEFVSSGSERLWGINAEELMSNEKAWSSYIHADDVEKARRLARENYGDGSLDHEYRIITPDGKLRWVRDRAFPVKDIGGKVRRIVGFTVDTTERKQAEEFRANLLAREQEARAQAETANRTKDEFLAIVSHELRSPLNAMLGWARVLRSESVDQQTHDHAIQVIEQSAEMQSRLIEDLLDSARIASGKLRIESHPVNLIPVIQSAIDTVYPSAESKGVEISKQLDPNAGIITGDAERLQQIIWNVLSNAVKFTPKGGGVEIELKRLDSKAAIVVRDTGRGIKPEDMRHIFDRFRQADSSTTRRAGGLGLGLSLVKNLVELHGGNITAESEGEGKGATFTISLPLRAVGGGVRASVAENDFDEFRISGSLGSLPSLKGLNILTVDDEVQARDLVATLLTRFGASVTTASSSAEAIDVLTSNDPQPGFDLIVSDIGMPDENGYTMIRRIRHLPAPIGKIPAIALTAFGRAEDRINALEAGFQMHVPKPVEPAELMMVIASLTGRSLKTQPEKSEGFTG